MPLKTSAAWYTRLSAVAPQSGADDRAKLRTFSSLWYDAFGLRCIMEFKTPLRMTTRNSMNGYGKRMVNRGGSTGEMRHAVAKPQCSGRISHRPRVVFAGAGRIY